MTCVKVEPGAEIQNLAHSICCCNKIRQDQTLVGASTPQVFGRRGAIAPMQSVQCLYAQKHSGAAKRCLSRQAQSIC